MSLIADFKARFPEFDESAVDTYLPTLEPVWPCYYGFKYEGCHVEAILNLLAHLLVGELSAGSGNVKSTSSKTVGNVSVRYADGLETTSESQDFFSTTKYGKRFWLLTQSRYGGVAV